MKLSTPVIPCALILSFAMVVASGCGAKGGKTDPAATAFLARFLAGDPSVKADGHEITFSEGGAPSDGSVERVDLTALVDKLLSQDIQLPAVSGVQVNYDDSVVEPALRIEYVSPTSIQDKSIPGGNFHLVMALALPLYEDPEGRMFLGRNADLRADREAYKARFTSGPTTRFGLLETGFSAELTGIQTGDAVAYSLGLRQAPLTSGVEWKAEAWVNDAKVADLGTFPPDTEHATSSTFSVPLWQHGLPVELRLQPDDDTQWPAFTVRCHSDIGLDALYEPRVYDTPFAPEAVSSIEAELFQVLHDSASPLAPGDFPIEMAGQGLFIGVCLGSGSLEEVDSTDPSPGSAAYSSSFTSRWRGSFNKPTTGGGEHSLTSADLIGAARVLVGAWGVSIANYDTGLGAFETHAIDEIGNMTDVHPFDGDTSATDLVYVDHSGDAIKFIESDAQEQYVLAPGKTISNVAWAGASGRVVSAFRHPSGDLLFVTDGEPGELWVLTPGATTATKIADTYDAPRRVRCAGDIVAVGCYGSALGFGGLRILVRGPTGVYAEAPFSRLGARSVGIDTKVLSGGRVAIASTGFLTNNLIVTIVDGSTGEILDDQVIPLPAGCTGPGHCAFVRDAGVDGVFVTCNTSNQVVLMPVNLDP